jgi:hypothetical protein
MHKHTKRRQLRTNGPATPSGRADQPGPEPPEKGRAGKLNTRRLGVGVLASAAAGATGLAAAAPANATVYTRAFCQNVGLAVGATCWNPYARWDLNVGGRAYGSGAETYPPHVPAVCAGIDSYKSGPVIRQMCTGGNNSGKAEDAICNPCSASFPEVAFVHNHGQVNYYDSFIGTHQFSS